MEETAKTNNKRSVGTRYERIAAGFLRWSGYRILESNFRCRQGEIDLIAEEQGTLCFVEVKYRSTLRCGYPGEAVSRHKQEKIRLVSQYYLLTHPWQKGRPVRFDVVEIVGEQIRILRGAF